MSSPSSHSSEESAESIGALPTASASEPVSCIEIQLSTYRIARGLSWTVCFLVCISTLGQLYRYLVAKGEFSGLVQLFFVDSENNLPSTYSSFALLLCSLLLGVIAVAQSQQHDRFARSWKMLSLIFLYLAVDELASIHEMAIEPMRNLLKAGGVFYYTWIIPGAGLLLLFCLSYLKFLRALPRRIRKLFIQSGLIFVLGALAIELPEGWVAANYGHRTLAFILLVTLEETLEMLSIVLFIYTLLFYIRTYIQKPVQIRIS